MKISSFFSIAFLAFANISSAQTVSTCPGGTYPFQLSSAVLSPYPVVIGENVTVSASGFLAEGHQVEQGASYKIQLRLGAVTGNLSWILI